MALMLLAVVLLIVALVAYFAGHRQKQAWGKPVVILAVLGLVAVVAYRLIAGPTYRAKPSATVTATQFGYFDNGTKELILLPGPPVDGAVKDPKTGEKTMWPAYICQNPDCPRRAELGPGEQVVFADETPGRMTRGASVGAILMKPLRCAYCGEPAEGNPLGIIPPQRYIISPAEEKKAE